MENIYSVHINAEQIGGNMTRKELLEKIKAVGFTEEQEELIKKCLGIEDKKWKPKEEENFYFVNSCGDIFINTFHNTCDDKFRILTNNYFKTEEEAEFKLEQIKVYNELKNFADENNEEIDWKSDTLKHHIFYDYDENKPDIYGSISYEFIGQIYFSSRKLAEQAIKKVGADRIKKYLFGVE